MQELGPSLLIGAMEEAKTFFRQISAIHDDERSQKTARFLSTGDQDSAFSSLGSNGDHPYHMTTDYLEAQTESNANKECSYVTWFQTADKTLTRQVVNVVSIGGM
eukprot:sb/3477929/